MLFLLLKWLKNPFSCPMSHASLLSIMDFIYNSRRFEAPHLIFLSLSIPNKFTMRVISSIVNSAMLLLQTKQFYSANRCSQR